MWTKDPQVIPPWLLLHLSRLQLCPGQHFPQHAERHNAQPSTHWFRSINSLTLLYAGYLEHRTAQYSTPCGHKLARAQQPAVSTGNRLGVNELIEAPGAAPETQAWLASLAQPEHTESPTKTALMPRPGSNGP
ncbi:uncharacterized [Tachysurus ichikawai]